MEGQKVVLRGDGFLYAWQQFDLSGKCRLLVFHSHAYKGDTFLVDPELVEMTVFGSLGTTLCVHQIIDGTIGPNCLYLCAEVEKV